MSGLAVLGAIAAVLLAAPADASKCVSDQAVSTLDKLRATWSWDTLPVFLHSMNTSGPWTAGAAQRVARYQFATLEKRHGLPPVLGRNRYDASGPAGCRQVTSADPSAVALYYLNSVIDYPFSALHDLMVANASWRLKDALGKDVIILGSRWVFNHSVPEVRRAWLDACLGATAQGCDGCFVDRSGLMSAYGSTFQAAHKSTVTALNAELKERGKLAVNNNAGVLAMGTTAMMIEDFVASERCILRLQELVRRGLVVQAHAGDYVDDGSGDAVHSCRNGGTNAMAAFLIGAGEQSYYHCSGSMWSSAARWPAVPDLWLDWLAEYDRPLGTPRGPATKGTDGIYRRDFDFVGALSAGGVTRAVGTTAVTFDARRGNGTIVWADGTTQVGLPSGLTADKQGCKWQTM